MGESMAILLLEGRLEGLSVEAHARRLLDIPRVVALEPSRVRGPRFVREGAAMRQATRVWLPGELRAVVLYHPAQYPLARALTSVHPDAELWYAAPDSDRIAGDPEAEQLRTHDRAARERAAGVLAVNGANVDDGPLRERLEALEVISSRAFVPEARLRGGWAVRKGLMRRA